MPTLILVNGAPGTGKSTVARRYAELHPLTLALDIDVVRSLLGGWRTTPGEAGILARRISLTMITTTLEAGHDVVVAQYLGRIGFVEQLAATAADAGVPFVETVLTAPLDTAVARFTARSASAVDDHQVAAAVADARALVSEAAAAVEAVAGQRPGTVTIDAGGEPETTCARLAEVVAGRPGART